VEIDEIMELLRHRYPFLLVDRITRLDEKVVEGYKNVTINEPFFSGHFPGYPIMPGVLVIEALAQTAGVMLMKNNPDLRSSTPLFLGIEKARFRRQVRPGDVLHMTCEIVSRKMMIWKLKATAMVSGEVMCAAELLVGFGPKKNNSNGKS
jgi:3-hydroxyacyl-[acyl-carrier-protein] dehydratase